MPSCHFVHLILLSSGPKVPKSGPFKNEGIHEGPAGYLDEISRSGQELGCMCSLQWVAGVSSLPDSMITDKGRSELDRVTAVIQAERQPENKPQSPAIDAGPSVPKSRLMRWFGFRGS